MSTAKAISTFYLQAAVQLPRNTCSSAVVYREPTWGNGLDRLCVDNRDQGGVVSDPRVQTEHPGIELTIWGTLHNIHGPKQSCQPIETCLMVAVIHQWALSNLTQTLLLGRAIT